MNTMNFNTDTDTFEEKLITPLNLDASTQTPFFDRLSELQSQPDSPNPFIPPSSTEESDNLPSSSSSPASISPGALALQTSVTRKRKSIQESHQTKPTPQNFLTRALKTVSSRRSASQEGLPSEQQRKNRRVDTKNISANTYLIISCPYCSAPPLILSAYCIDDLIINFKMHMRDKHFKTVDNIEKYIKDNLQS